MSYARAGSSPAFGTIFKYSLMRYSQSNPPSSPLSLESPASYSLKSYLVKVLYMAVTKAGKCLKNTKSCMVLSSVN